MNPHLSRSWIDQLHDMANGDSFGSSFEVARVDEKQGLARGFNKNE